MALNIPTFRERLTNREKLRPVGKDLATIRFTYGTSRAADAYGWNVVSCYVDGDFAARCSGGGYDMKGTALGGFIEKAFQPELLALADRAGSVWHEDTKRAEHFDSRKSFDGLRPGRLYGFTVYKRKGKPVKARLDGGCGFTSMESILAALGYELHRVDFGGKRSDVYLMSRLTKAEA